MLNILALIVARSGSKKIKNKNLMKICGKSLINWSAASVQESSFKLRKIISSDMPHIFKPAKRFGFEAPFRRPKNLAQDSSSTHSVVKHALIFMENYDKKKYDLCLLLQPTCPLRTAEMIDKAIKLYIKNPSADSVISIVNVGASHPHRMYTISTKNQLMPFSKSTSDPMKPRQKLPPVYIRSGDIYLSHRRTILKKNSLIGKSSIALIIPPEQTVNIDEPSDVAIAKLKIKNRLKK